MGLRKRQTSEPDVDYRAQARVAANHGSDAAKAFADAVGLAAKELVAKTREATKDLREANVEPEPQSHHRRRKVVLLGIVLAVVAMIVSSRRMRTVVEGLSDTYEPPAQGASPDPVGSATS